MYPALLGPASFGHLSKSDGNEEKCQLATQLSIARSTPLRQFRLASIIMSHRLLQQKWLGLPTHQEKITKREGGQQQKA